MLKFTVKVDTRELQRALAKAGRDAQRGTAEALNDTAREVRRDVMDELPRRFDRPTPFTLRAIGYAQAVPGKLRASVFVREAQERYLRLQIEGGTERPKRRALLRPEGVPVNSYGNIPRNKVRQLLKRADTFSGTVRGIAGIWQRTGRKVRLLVRYDDAREVKPRLDFYGVARRSIERRLVANVQRRIAAALRGGR